MQGIWKSYLGKNNYYKDCKIKNNKYKHMKKDKFSYYNKSYDKLSKNAKRNLTGDVWLNSNIVEGNYTIVNNPHYYNKRDYDTLKYYGMLINNPLKKYYKKLSSVKSRRAIQRWIKVSDWEKEVDTHMLSKSIERMCI